EERHRYYDDSKKLGLLMGVPETMLPPMLEDFARYMTATIESETISVGAPARAILYPRPWFLQTVAPANALITAGLLPPKLRRAYGLRWSGRRESVLRLVAGSARAALPLVPRMIRVVPHARAAERLMGG